MHYYHSHHHQHHQNGRIDTFFRLVNASMCVPPPRNAIQKCEIRLVGTYITTSAT